MSALSTPARNKLRDAVFGLPGKRAYPVNDRSHAANAKARAAQQLKAGNLTQAQYDQIIAKANKVLGKKRSAGASMMDGDADD